MKALDAYGSHTNYVYELAGRYPRIVELSADKKSVRIRPEIHSQLCKLVDIGIRQAKKTLGLN